MFGKPFQHLQRVKRWIMCIAPYAARCLRWSDLPEVSHFFDVPGWERRLAWDTQGARYAQNGYGAEWKKHEE